MTKQDWSTRWTSFMEALPWLLMPCCSCLVFVILGAAIFGLGWWLG